MAKKNEAQAEQLAPDTLLVRLRPYDPKKRQLCRRYVIKDQLFDGDQGWYQVPAWFAEELRDLTQADGTTPLFDVGDVQQAENIEKKEFEEKQEKAPPVRPHRTNLVNEASKPVARGARVPRGRGGIPADDES